MAARITEPAVGASTCASGSQVCTGHIGIFTANEAKKASQAQVCRPRGKPCLQQRRDVGGAGVPVHRHDGEQHQHRAEQRVEEELEARIDPARPAPDADDQEHRNEAALEEQVEQHEIERAEGADHQRLEHQERDHVFLDAASGSAPARDDADRHQRGGEDHERQRNAVDAHVIGDGAAEPGPLLDELEFGRARDRSARPGSARSRR